MAKEILNQKSQKGFGKIGIILIVLAVALIGLGSSYVYFIQKEKKLIPQEKKIIQPEEILQLEEEKPEITPSNLDSDNDGLIDEKEKQLGTDPNNSDTDGDGYLDGEEVTKGYNPKGSGKPGIPKEKVAVSEAKTVYFGKGWEGKYSFVNVNTGEAKEIIPSGYEIIDQHSYDDPFPNFFILRKNDDLFSHSLINGSFNKIPVGPLKKSEEVRVHPSISDKSKFFIIINDYLIDDFKKARWEWGVPAHELVSSKKYFLDAGNNQVQSADNIDLPGISDFSSCFKYDSKYFRFFIWPCGEGIGSSIPLTVYDLTSKTQKDIVTFQDFGLSGNIGLIAVEYNNGYFLTIPKSKDKFSKIIIVNPTKGITKEVFAVSQEVRTKLNEVYPYSALLAKEKNTIVLGGGDFILLLRFDENKQITNSTYIPEQDLYANFIFSHSGKLYYQLQTTKSIRVINLDSWQIEKSISAEPDEEITLIFFE